MIVERCHPRLPRNQKQKSIEQHDGEIGGFSFSKKELDIARQLLKAYPAPDRSVDHLAYVAHMNSLTSMAEETVLRDLICV